MRKINYYVATSIDGYIEGPGGDISGFVADGDGLKKYLSDLQSFDTVIMGRKTYEFGYQYGLDPGKLAYPHMEHYIFSEFLDLKDKDDKLHICPIDISIIEDLKQGNGSDIYLCGGGIFAGWLLENKLIDILTIKLNPLILGGGTQLFGGNTKQYHLEIISRDLYDDGLSINTYKILYSGSESNSNSDSDSDSDSDSERN